MNDEQTTRLSHKAASQALEALFVEQDRAKAFEEVDAWQVHRHVADCEACRRQYDGLALTDRLLEHRGDAPCELPRSNFEASFGEASFMGALDQMLEEEQADSGPQAAGGDAGVVDLPTERSRRMQLSSRIGLAAAVLLVAGASWYAFNNVPNTPNNAASNDSQFQARSAATAHDHGLTDAPAIEIFCAERTPDGVEFTGTKDAPFGLLTCPADAQIKLAYKNQSPELRYAAFFGVDQHGRIYWYGPTPADMNPVSVEESSQFEPFGESIRLQVNHEPGPVRVVGLFAGEPIDFPALERATDQVDAQELFRGEKPDELMAHGILTSSTFEVTTEATNE